MCTNTYTCIHPHTRLNSMHTQATHPANSNTCSELDSGLPAPSSGLLWILQYPPFYKICTLGTPSCSWLAGTSGSDLMPFCRETLPRLSRISNANIICTLTLHRAQWFRAGLPRVLAEVEDGHGKEGHDPVSHHSGMPTSSSEFLVLGQKPIPGCGSHLTTSLWPGRALS